MLQNCYLPELPSAHFLDLDWPAQPLEAALYKQVLNLSPRVVATQEADTRRRLDRTEPESNQERASFGRSAAHCHYGWIGGSTDEPVPGELELPVVDEPSDFFGFTSADRSRLMERKLSPGVT